MIKIAIVEDSCEIQAMTIVLREAGYEVLAIIPVRGEKSSGGYLRLSALEEIRKAIVAFSPEIVFMDHNFTGVPFSGADVVAAAKLPKEKVIGMSSDRQKYAGCLWGGRDHLANGHSSDGPILCPFVKAKLLALVAKF